MSLFPKKVEYPFKGIVHQKIKIFARPHVITNLYDFLSSVEHKRRYRESPVVPSVVLDSSEVIIDPA